MFYNNFRLIVRFFRSRIAIFILLFLSLNGYSQPGAEIGIAVGGSYYIGEFNDSHYKDVKSYVGGLYRLNFNDRYALRLMGIFTDIETEKTWPANEPLPTSFSTSVKDLSAVLEFNFRSFLVPKTRKSSVYSPYIFMGAGVVIANERMEAAIPFGVGVKLYLWNNISMGVEWGARKLFTDKLDGLEDVWGTGESNFFTKDWMFTTGITISYRFPMREDCKAYY